MFFCGIPKAQKLVKGSQCTGERTYLLCCTEPTPTLVAEQDVTSLYWRKNCLPSKITVHWRDDVTICTEATLAAEDYGVMEGGC
jgi:hypothetical protein